jgi:hypothetical protein
VQAGEVPSRAVLGSKKWLAPNYAEFVGLAQFWYEQIQDDGKHFCRSTRVISSSEQSLWRLYVPQSPEIIAPNRRRERAAPKVESVSKLRAYSQD